MLGEQGRGSLAHCRLGTSQRLVYMGTLGKAAGASGAFVAAHEAVIECLLQNAPVSYTHLGLPSFPNLDRNNTQQK